MDQLARRNFGTPARLHRSGDLQISLTCYAGDSTLPMHEHADAYLCLVAGGAYRQTSSCGSDTECAAGLLLVHPQGHRHANRFAAQGGRCLSVFLSASISDQDSVRQLLSDHRQLRLPGTARLLARIESELGANDDASDLAMQSTVLELLAQSCRHRERAPRPRWLLRVVERLRDEPEAKLSLTELGALAGVHPSHLARRFQQTMGQSIGDYQRSLRIERACLALRDRERPIAAVAAEAGFADQSHFARVFKRIVGRTPRDFRQGLQIAS